MWIPRSAVLKVPHMYMVHRKVPLMIWSANWMAECVISQGLLNVSREQILQICVEPEQLEGLEVP